MMAIRRLFGGRSGDAGLFLVKKQQFGRTRSAHGRKARIQFNKLVFDMKTMKAITKRRHVTKY